VDVPILVPSKVPKGTRLDSRHPLRSIDVVNNRPERFTWSLVERSISISSTDRPRSMAAAEIGRRPSRSKGSLGSSPSRPLTLGRSWSGPRFLGTHRDAMDWLAPSQEQRISRLGW